MIRLRELVKTILHARDPLFGGQGKEETMGLSSWVGGYMREHGSLKLGGGIYERTWVSQAGWGGYTRDHGFLKLGGRIYERTWVSKARWEDI